MNKKIVYALLSGALMLPINTGVFAQSTDFASNSPFEYYCMDYINYTKDEIFNKLDVIKGILASENSLLRIKLKPGQKIYMVGDLHSDISALEFIEEFMRTHPNDKFIFLGDYVDRGYCGTEVFMKLANLKIANPDRTFLLRGNHEDCGMNYQYGFYKELKGKYLNETDAIYDKFNDIFDQLPLAAVVDCGTKKIFCVHGGICPKNEKLDTLTLDDLSNLPERNSNIITNPIVSSLLWSDPSDPEEYISNFESNPLRGAGFKYGIDAVNSFLRVNGLDYIVRAHQVANEGFTDHFGGIVKTVFSAPRYTGVYRNKGAILGFNNISNVFESIKFDYSTNSDFYAQVD